VKTVVAWVALTLLAAPAPAQVWFAGSFDEALAAARTARKPVLIDFYGVG
jgi:hypothetical protein